MAESGVQSIVTLSGPSAYSALCRIQCEVDLFIYFRSRQVRVFFADENDTKNRSMKIRRNRGPRKNYMEDSEDKPIQQSKFLC